MKKLKELNPKFTIVRELSDEEKAEVLKSLQFEAVDYTLREGSVGDKVVEVLTGNGVKEYSVGGFNVQLDQDELDRLEANLELVEGLPRIDFYILDKGYFVSITESVYNEVYYELAKLRSIETNEYKWAVKWIPKGADRSVEPILDCSVLYDTEAEAEKAINELSPENFNLVQPFRVEHVDIIGMLKG